MFAEFAADLSRLRALDLQPQLAKYWGYNLHVLRSADGSRLLIGLPMPHMSLNTKPRPCPVDLEGSG